MLVTPFRDDYRLNEDALRREVNWAIAAGADGVVAAPSIGEFIHLDEAERTRVSRPPYIAPADAAERIRKRLPLLNEVI